MSLTSSPYLQDPLRPQDWLGRRHDSGEQSCNGGLQNTHQEIKIKKLCLFQDCFYNKYLIFHYTLRKKQILWSSFSICLWMHFVLPQKMTRILIVTLLYSWKGGWETYHELDEEPISRHVRLGTLYKSSWNLQGLIIPIYPWLDFSILLPHKLFISNPIIFPGSLRFFVLLGICDNQGHYTFLAASHGICNTF